ncbi:aprataxin-like protein [Vanrija albida]|uniref:Aprataxin-like protein n=1 Tax=Vanrija albida TaxID=181172 RepID=A0ABR3QDU8_9TREE
MQAAGLGALRTYAEAANPAADIPASTLLIDTPHTIAIFDAYPKARYHFLVLPRLPSDLGPSITARDLDSLASLLRLPHAARDAVLRAMRNAATEVEEMVRDEMLKTEGWQWPVLAGFHAVPSMRHVHLHVISSDLVSPSLKTKKHYNSFRPDLGFFVSLDEVEEWCSDSDSQLAERQAGMLQSREQLLREPLACFKCHAELRNMPLLKEHLELELAKERCAAGR